MSAGVAALAISASTLAHIERPADARPALPDFAPSRAEPADRFLPSILGADDERRTFEAGGSRVLRQIEVVGNRALSDADVEAITARYLGRTVSYSDIQRLRDELTALYVGRGYVNSGAVIPAQRDVERGVLRVEIVEGRADRIVVRNQGGRLRDGYIRSRVERATAPVNIEALDKRLQVMQRDPRIKLLRASLRPTEERGVAELEVDVVEQPALRFRLTAANDVAPTIGAERVQLGLTHTNLTGFGDRLDLAYGRSEGFEEAQARYEVPLNRYDTTLGLSFRGSRSEMIEEPFDAFDIESRAATYGIALRQPLFQTPGADLELFATGEYRRSKSFLLGSGFPFSMGVEDGVTKLAVARAGLDYQLVREDYVLALRSTVSFGLDALGATRTGGRGDGGARIPDAEFVSFLGQAQLAYRTPFLGAQLVLRGDVQLSDAPLFGLEQFSVGGSRTVRGYRENELVADQGAVGSIEMRLPVPLPTDRFAVELAPFFDIGRAWNRDRPDVSVRTLSSGGVGLRIRPEPGRLATPFRFEMYWAKALERDIPDRAGDDLQDDGFHVRAVIEY